MKYLAAALLALTTLSAVSQEQVVLTDWLEVVKGERCEKTGAEIMGVSRPEGEGYQNVLVRIPKSKFLDETAMEEVRVVGQAPEEMEMPELFPDLETEWVDDYDNDYYGLLVRFNSDQKTPFRLYMSSDAGFFDGSVQP